MKHGDMHVVSSSVKLPIHLSMAGVNYCHTDYMNIRELSRITVIGYVLQGEGNVRVNSTTFRPKQGDVFILPRGTRHQVFADSDQDSYWTYIWFNMGGNSLMWLESFGLQTTHHITDTEVEPLFREGLAAAEQMEDRDNLQLTLLSISTKILAHLAGTMERRKNKLSTELQTMLHYLNQLDAEKFHSNHMSRHFAMSFKQINRLFKKEIGTTVYDYFLTQKINTAKMLLRDSAMAVSQISFRLGYSDPHYFSNIFRKKTGHSPSAYRQLKSGG
jgi:AraC family transcriptional regulator of arabinose operon